MIDGAYLAAKAVKRLYDDLKIPTLRGLGVDEKKFHSIVSLMAADAIASGSPEDACLSLLKRDRRAFSSTRGKE